MSKQKRLSRKFDKPVALRTPDLGAANEQLDVSEREPRLIVDNIPGLIALLSPNGDIDMVNRQLLEYCGRELEVIKSWATNDTIHPEDVPQFIEIFSRSIVTGSPYQAVHRLKRSDGVYRWFQSRGSPFRDGNGNVARWYVLLTDIDDQKRAEEALRESEYESRQIVDSIPGRVAVLNARGEVERVSQAILDYYGKTPEELDRWSEDDTIHPDDRPALVHAFAQSIATGEPTEFEIRLRRFDGVYRWFDLRGFPLRDRQGQIVRWYYLQTDIDERKQAEEALRESEYESRLIIDSIPGHVAVLSANGFPERVSQPVLDYYGKSLEELRLWTENDTIHPEDRPGVIEAVTRSIDTGDPTEFEIRLRRFDGVYRWFQLRGVPLRDRQGRIIRWYYLQTDIDERKRAEEALRESVYQSRLIVDSINGLITVVSANGEIEFLNRQLLEYLGLPMQVAKNWSTGDHVHPDDLAGIIQKYTGFMTWGDPTEFEVRLRRFDGEYRWFQVLGSTLRDRQGRVVRWYFLHLDIDDRKRAQDALNQARSELAHISRVTSLSALTASIAHEINQPLSGIMTNASTCLRMLNADPPNVDGARETARRTIRDGNRASDVTTRLRAMFSKREFTLESMDLNEATREILTLSVNDLQRNRVVVEPQLAEDLPAVYGDRVQLQQVILSLVRNASEAMGDVHDRPRRLVIRTQGDERGSVRLSVQDTGVGFGGQSLEKIFDSFYTTKSGGMGIGLSVSRSIIERHRGRLWAEPNEGPGATFAFSIPYASRGTLGGAPAVGNS
jgi:PAS domain S-box-containing protein